VRAFLTDIADFFDAEAKELRPVAADEAADLVRETEAQIAEMIGPPAPLH
jgi:hypothetical protein